MIADNLYTKHYDYYYCCVVLLYYTDCSIILFSTSTSQRCTPAQATTKQSRQAGGTPPASACAGQWKKYLPEVVDFFDIDVKLFVDKVLSELGYLQLLLVTRLPLSHERLAETLALACKKPHGLRRRTRINPLEKRAMNHICIQQK